jgi:hypothetical protein
MTKTIIAFDPGGTTGWATWQQDNVSIWNEPRWSRGQLGPEEHHEELDQLLGLQHTMDYTVVTESFEFRNRARSGLVLVPLEYIGVMKRWVQANERHGRVRYVEQTASMGKGFVTDEVIKKLDLWYPGYKHAMDATRHLLYYVVNSSDLPISYRHELLRKGWK